MSYENTNCPCGGKKERETMLCAACNEHLASTVEMAALNHPEMTWEQRRSSAIRLIGMARRRVRSLPLAYRFQ